MYVMLGTFITIGIVLISLGEEGFKIALGFSGVTKWIDAYHYLLWF